MTLPSAQPEALPPDALADVLVVGAGATGLALACDLARRDVRALVIEQQDGLFPGSRGKGVQPRTQEVFDDLGVIDAIRAAGGRYPKMLTWRGDQPVREWDLIAQDATEPGTPYPAPLMIPQWRTQEILHERLLQLGGSVAFGTRLAEFTQDAEAVTAVLESADGDRRTVRARYLVGADGGRSTVRRALGIAMDGETVDPRPALVADVRIDGLGRGNWHAWPEAPEGALLLCPLAGTDLFQLFAQYATGEPVLSLDEVRRLIGERTPLDPEAVREVRWASDFRPRAALADRYRAGRVLLAGDAAHVHSPAGGQGLNTGVQDAYNLGWKLGQVLRHGAPDSLLDSYESERRPVAADVLGLSTRLHRAGRSGDPVSVQRGKQTSQLGVGYPDSPLTAERRTGLPEDALRAGGRVPDFELPDSTRLFDLLRGPHFTLLAVATPAPATHPGILTREFAALDPLSPGLYLIRPDGYLGLATRDAADLADYLALVSGQHAGRAM
ncbi:FAD-dependent monooxygenase [Kitasatospora sp. NBC_01250]|uniref:FAD-dependent monooxygenase n=1 Tax=Kitasatospora sp. NBC_01250 TaxID=2903571 RepID=UPI002E37C32D|nr:FAD-dependent monooxygenase [Kitasatospora sp. NBC_01250]